MSDELTEADYKRFDTRWKSDVDLKLDRLIRFADQYEDFVGSLAERERSHLALRRAIIEKTLIGLVWAALVFLSVASWQSIKAALK